jgi:hypothetical protein
MTFLSKITKWERVQTPVPLKKKNYPGFRDEQTEAHTEA